MYDLIIIGGGPAGIAAGVYASRKKLKTLFLTDSFGGQSIVSDGIENWIGTIKISGPQLATDLENHLRAYAGDIVEIKTGIKVQDIEKLPINDNDGNTSHHIFKVMRKTENKARGTEEESYLSKSILIATGSKRRKLEAIGADIFEHKGLTYCATCDGPLFTNQDVAVIGGGNAAFESAAQLASYCKSVTLINRSDSYRADPITVEKILAKPNIKSITNTIINKVYGSAFVEGVEIKNIQTNKIEKLPLTGIFIEIGMLPNTDFVKNIVERDEYNKIIVNPKTQATTTSGIWAAGDCTDSMYHQNNIAAGDGVKALEDIFVHLSQN